MARRSTIDLGHDAFLDIVANLVGILIILLAVVGSQSSEAIRRAAATMTETLAVDDEDAETAWQHAADIATTSAAAQADSDRLEAMVNRYDQMIIAEKQSRDRLLDLLAIAKTSWTEAQQSLDSERIEKAKQTLAIEDAQSQLATLRAQIDEVKSDTPPPIAVEHLPTPMARAVFNDEIHLRIKDNRISIVPFDRLLEDIRDQLQRQMRSAGDGRKMDSAGPYDGYVARYIADRQTGVMSRGGRTGRAVRVEMAGMIITPLSEPIGVTLQDATGRQSVLAIELAGRDPARTTITAWVYPDSFETFSAMKRHLYRKGFATAARPMKFGMPIGASPQGSRSQSQ